MSTLLTLVRHQLVRSIANHEYATGETLPPKAQLARQLGCSEATIDRVLVDLAQQGVVRRVRRKGTVVVGVEERRHLGRAVLLQAQDDHTNRILTEPVFSALTRQGFEVDVVPMTADPALAADRCIELASRIKPAQFIAVLGFAPSRAAPATSEAAARRRLVAAIERMPWRVGFDVADEPSELGIHQVVVDQVSATCKVVEHLLMLGHRRIAVETGMTGENSWVERSAHLARHLIEQGGGTMIPLTPCAWSTPEQLFAWYTHHQPTALWTITDYSATLLSNQLSRREVQIPANLSIIGRNDTPWCDMVTPALSSVSWNPQGIARAIATIFKQAAQTQQMPAVAVTRVEPQLVVRQSTGPCSRRSRPSG